MVNEKEIETAFNEFTNEQLVAMLKELIAKDQSFKKEILNFVQKNAVKFKVDKENEENLSEYSSLWSDAEIIISDFNEYGGGPEEDEDVVYDNIHKIVELFKKGKLDEETKNEFIDGCFEEYYCDNSGFEDLLRESIFEVCNSRKDWLKVIEKLKKSPSDYDLDRITKIYKEKLDEDEKYLQIRLKNMESCLDYYDLVDYYFKKGQINEAAKIAEEGITKGKGWKRELLEFLIKYYKEQNDYANILRCRLISFEEEPSLEKYIELKKFCKKDDLERVLKQLHERLKHSRDDVRAEIDYFNKNYKEVFIYLKSLANSYSFEYKFKEWAKKLEAQFPKEILKIYEEKANRLIETKMAKNYSEAASHLAGAKRILLAAKGKNEWQEIISKLRKKYIKLPALQKELEKLEK